MTTAGEQRALSTFRALRQILFPLIAFVGSVLLTIYPLVTDQYFIRGVLIILGISFALVGVLFTVLATPTRNQLLSSTSSMYTYLAGQNSPRSDRMRMVLASLMSNLGLAATHNRASLFTRTDDGRWLLVARHSANAVLAEPGRQRYSSDQGLVNQTWENEDAYYSDLPHDRTQWNEMIAEAFNMQLEDVEQLRMQSRSYACLRIDRSIDGHGRAAGVLILESVLPTGVLPEVLDELQLHHSIPLLAIECENHIAVAKLLNLDAVKKVKSSRAANA